MRKKILITLNVMLMAIFIIIISVFTIKDIKGNDKELNFDSPQQVYIENGVLTKAEVQEIMPIAGDTIYMDNKNNSYYINNNSGNLELVIFDEDVNTSVSMSNEVVADEEIIHEAERYISIWYDGYNSHNFSWEVTQDTDYTKRAYMYQIFDGEIIGIIAAIEYDNFGNMLSGSFWFDAVLNDEQIKNIIDEQKAIAIAKDVLINDFNVSLGEFDEISIISNTHSGHNYWYIKYLNTDEYVSGYIIEIEKITGEIGNVSEIK